MFLAAWPSLLKPAPREVVNQGRFSKLQSGKDSSRENTANACLD
jgi:hypothetical protein